MMADGSLDKYPAVQVSGKEIQEQIRSSSRDTCRIPTLIELNRIPGFSYPNYIAKAHKALAKRGSRTG